MEQNGQGIDPGAEREAAEEDMGEVNANSLARLTEGMLVAAAWDYENVSEDARIVAAACPETVKTVTQTAVNLINENPEAETVMNIFLAGFLSGWRSREALMESEELEKLAQAKS